MEKKYRLKKDLPDCKVGTIFISLGSAGNFYGNDNQSVVIENKIVESNPDWFEEVGTDTLESILNRNITNKQIAVSQCKYEVKQYIIKQKIELLKEVLSHKCSFENIGGQWIGKVVIDDKISELEKGEIT